MKTNLKGYGQYFRSGISMKQKWSLDKLMQQEKKASQQKPLPMGRNE